MGSKSRKQTYTYQYKTNSVINSMICAGLYNSAETTVILGVSVPDNIIEMKALWMELAISFDPAEPPANCTIKHVSVGNVIGSYLPDFSQFVYTYPNPGTITLSPSPVANASNQLGTTVNLQSALNGIYYYPSTEQTSSYFELTFTLPQIVNNATINLWKVDMIYTTQGIR